MPPKRKEENLEGKMESILEKLDVICTGRDEDNMKLDEISNRPQPFKMILLTSTQK